MKNFTNHSPSNTAYVETMAAEATGSGTMAVSLENGACAAHEVPAATDCDAPTSIQGDLQADDCLPTDNFEMRVRSALKSCTKDYESILSDAIKFGDSFTKPLSQKARELIADCILSMLKQEYALLECLESFDDESEAE